MTSAFVLIVIMWCVRMRILKPLGHSWVCYVGGSLHCGAVVMW